MTQHQRPGRFQVSKGTLAVDTLMSVLIPVGGVLVILAVFGIFVFILSQIFPLFRGAHVEEGKTVQLPVEDYIALGADEWSELPFVASRSGKVWFYDLAGDRGLIEHPTPLAGDRTLSALYYDAARKFFAVGASDGGVSLVTLKYRAEFVDGKRTVKEELEHGPFLPVGPAGAPVEMISAGDADSSKMVATVSTVDGKPQLHVAELVRKKGLMGLGPLTAGRKFDLTPQLSGKPVRILIPGAADSVIVLQDNGEVEYFYLRGSEFELRQRFRPFGDVDTGAVASMDFVLGDVSLVFTNPTGRMRIYSLFVKPQDAVRTFGLTRELDALDGGAQFFSASLRNKSFLTGSGSQVSLRHSTTETVRWERKLPFEVKLCAVGPKYESLFLLDPQSRLHVRHLEDPHPEASFQGLFGKLWYEGGSKPEYVWQSSGGDEFEPKLSLVPLIFGTLKGTFYAMIFAVPIALMAAIYTSQFLRPEHRTIVKPVMEIMASLPSVVLGFLAALWLAPLLETRVPSVLAIIILLPLTAFLFGKAWSNLPIRYRILVKPGYEFLAFMPVLIAMIWVGWNLGPVLEKICFVVTEPGTGVQVADFRRWWPAVTGTAFEQRNSMVVGFIMGFAVIPIIFTISEDALSNVPATLRSGSLALGASRWQTAMKVVLPTASPGIFSALMIGLGRAVGETMIVVMATGNTPIMEMNIFSGMRTLAANVAVELPEAPQGGTLFRTLFLGAMVLFLMTFVVNTLAEILRQHLRTKYKTV